MVIQGESVLENLANEVVRKLRLASEAETKGDREIICEEVFCDVTGQLDAHAKVIALAYALKPVNNRVVDTWTVSVKSLGSRCSASS